MRRALIVQHSAALDESAHSGLLLADGLREAGWATHVAFGFEGPMIERYAAAGHRTHVVPNAVRTSCKNTYTSYQGSLYI
jgi:hypothetical protein